MKRAKKKKKRKKKLRLSPTFDFFLIFDLTLVYVLTRIIPHAIFDLLLHPPLPTPLALLPETTWNHAVQQIRFHLSNLTEYCISMYATASISSVIIHRIFDRYPPIWTVIEARQHRGMGGERGKSVNLDIFQFILFQGNERTESWKSRSLFPLSILKIGIYIRQVGWI